MQNMQRTADQMLAVLEQCRAKGAVDASAISSFASSLQKWAKQTVDGVDEMPDTSKPEAGRAAPAFTDFFADSGSESDDMFSF